MKNINNKILVGFTLAEVLITLGIIGVVASITIPTLMNSMQENNYKVAYKKAFSVASQAWQQAVADNLIVPRPSWGDNQTRIDNFNVFKSYFKIAKDCNSSNNSECWASGDLYWSAPESNANAFIDSSGMSWSIASNINTARGADIYVDTNGMKLPNKFGQDRFPLLPVAIDNNHVGLPQKIIPNGDCINTTDCPSYANSCSSIDKHPCYYTQWLYN